VRLEPQTKVVLVERKPLILITLERGVAVQRLLGQMVGLHLMMVLEAME
jgi:hypothetical protein